MFKTVFRLAILCLLFAGCKKSELPTGTGNTTKSGSTAKSTSVNSAKQPKRPAPVKRSSMEGNWVVQCMMPEAPQGSRQGQDPTKWFPLVLIEISKSSKEIYTAKLLAKSQMVLLDEVQLKDMTAKSATLVLQTQGQAQAEIHVRLLETTAIGNINMRAGSYQPARMIATNQRKLTGFENPENPAQLQKFIKAFNALGTEKTSDKLMKFTEDFPQSPLTYLARDFVIRFAFANKNTAEFQKLKTNIPLFIERLKHWGPRLQQFYQWQDASTLLGIRRFPETAHQLLVGALENAKILKTPQSDLDIMTFRKDYAEIEIAYKKITTGKPSDLTQAKAKLIAIQKKHIHRTLVLHGLALQAEKTGDIDSAITNYGLLSTLPLVEQHLAALLKIKQKKLVPVRETLGKLWNKKHGNLDKLDDYLKTLYSSSIDQLVTEKAKPRTGINLPVVLCELFTNGTAQNGFAPTVAPEFAVSALERTYSPSDVIVLRYHMSQRAPDPDPLMFRLSKSRAFDYLITGSPNCFVNGDPVFLNVGHCYFAGGNYKKLRKAIDEILTGKPSPVELLLKASLKEGEISFSVQAIAGKEPLEDLRLRVVLAESGISYKSANGIIQHDMVVRHMPGGVEGVKATDGKFQFAESFSLADVKKKHLEFLASFAERENVKFAAKPIDLKNLRLVAFIQNTRTRKVLQTTSIAIAGSESTPPVKKPPVKKPATKKPGKTKPAPPTKKAKPAPKKTTPAVAPKPKRK